MPLSNLTPDYVKRILEYKDGDLYWKVSRSNIIKVGQKAGSTRPDGYRQVSIDNKLYLAHRIVWLIHYGYIPVLIDHIDNNPRNNRIENLREANKKQNAQNAKIWKSNTSGFKNVAWKESIKKWRVRLTINGKDTTVGQFNDLELAVLVAEEARDKYYKHFARSL